MIYFKSISFWRKSLDGRFLSVGLHFGGFCGKNIHMKHAIPFLKIFFILKQVNEYKIQGCSKKLWESFYYSMLFLLRWNSCEYHAEAVAIICLISNISISCFSTSSNFIWMVRIRKKLFWRESQRCFELACVFTVSS